MNVESPEPAGVAGELEAWVAAEEVEVVEAADADADAGSVLDVAAQRSSAESAANEQSQLSEHYDAIVVEERRGGWQPVHAYAAAEKPEAQALPNQVEPLATAPRCSGSLLFVPRAFDSELASELLEVAATSPPGLEQVAAHTEAAIELGAAAAAAAAGVAVVVRSNCSRARAVAAAVVLVKP